MVLTDHKLLTFNFAKEAEPWSAHQQRHLAYISDYTLVIKHITGKENTVADALSRIVISNIHVQVGLDYHALVLAQQGDHYQTHLTSLHTRDIPMGVGDNTLICDVSLEHPRPMVGDAESST